MSRSHDGGAVAFETEMGAMGLAYTDRGIDRVVLPCRSTARATALLAEAAPGRVAVAAPPPTPIRGAVRRMQAHLAGKPDGLADVRLDLSGVSPFAARVYRALRRVPPGRVLTYGELAARVSAPGASRAVGRAMATNPVPLLVPCHRVVTVGRKLGGFSADEGAALKARMLFSEGVILNPVHAAGITHLRRVDRKLAPVIRRAGPFLPNLGPTEKPFDALVEAIVYQQLSMKAAATIAGRLWALGQDGYPDHARLKKLPDARLRQVGLSRQKISYVRDLAERVASGSLRLAGLQRLADEAVIDALCQVRGIGRWSAQMFLIFHLDRLDVLPVADLGFQKAAAALYGADPADLAALEGLGERWRPYRSMATWYLWRSLEAGGLG